MLGWTIGMAGYTNSIGPHPTLSGQSALPITAIIAVFGAELGSEPKNAHTSHLSHHDPRALKRRFV